MCKVCHRGFLVVNYRMFHTFMIYKIEFVTILLKLTLIRLTFITKCFELCRLIVYQNITENTFSLISLKKLEWEESYWFYEYNHQLCWKLRFKINPLTFKSIYLHFRLGAGIKDLKSLQQNCPKIVSHERVPIMPRN